MIPKPNSAGGPNPGHLPDSSAAPGNDNPVPSSNANPGSSPSTNPSTNPPTIVPGKRKYTRKKPFMPLEQTPQKPDNQGTASSATNHDDPARHSARHLAPETPTHLLELIVPTPAVTHSGATVTDADHRIQNPNRLTNTHNDAESNADSNAERNAESNTHSSTRHMNTFFATNDVPSKDSGNPTVSAPTITNTTGSAVANTNSTGSAVANTVCDANGDRNGPSDTNRAASLVTIAVEPAVRVLTNGAKARESEPGGSKNKPKYARKKPFMPLEATPQQPQQAQQPQQLQHSESRGPTTSTTSINNANTDVFPDTIPNNRTNTVDLHNANTKVFPDAIPNTSANTNLHNINPSNTTETDGIKNNNSNDKAKSNAGTANINSNMLNSNTDAQLISQATSGGPGGLGPIGTVTSHLSREVGVHVSKPNVTNNKVVGAVTTAVTTGDAADKRTNVKQRQYRRKKPFIPLEDTPLTDSHGRSDPMAMETHRSAPMPTHPTHDSRVNMHATVHSVRHSGNVCQPPQSQSQPSNAQLVAQQNGIGKQHEQVPGVRTTNQTSQPAERCAEQKLIENNFESERQYDRKIQKVRPLTPLEDSGMSYGTLVPDTAPGSVPNTAPGTASHTPLEAVPGTISSTAPVQSTEPSSVSAKKADEIPPCPLVAVLTLPGEAVLRNKREELF